MTRAVANKADFVKLSGKNGRPTGSIRKMKLSRFVLSLVTLHTRTLNFIK